MKQGKQQTQVITVANSALRLTPGEARKWSFRDRTETYALMLVAKNQMLFFVFFTAAALGKLLGAMRFGHGYDSVKAYSGSIPGIICLIFASILTRVDASTRKSICCLWWNLSSSSFVLVV